MVFKSTKLQGVYIIELDRIEDNRGFFARSWCKKEFEKHGLNSIIAQCSLSHNSKKGTVRGMHFQIKPYGEIKLVTCCKGSIFDVIIDLRETSRTYGEWISVNLTEKNNKTLYIPKGFAHGFQTLENATNVYYQISEYYHPDSSMGIRWNDTFFGIDWPLDCSVISKKDSFYPLFKGKENG